MTGTAVPTAATRPMAARVAAGSLARPGDHQVKITSAPSEATENSASRG